jgi:hypothetical protein
MLSSGIACAISDGTSSLRIWSSSFDQRRMHTRFPFLLAGADDIWATGWARGADRPLAVCESVCEEGGMPMLLPDWAMAAC